MRIFFAILLFLYAAWQIFTFVGAPNKGQAIGQIIWALLAIAGGIYLVRKVKSK
jgi:hypothetical protein